MEENNGRKAEDAGNAGGTQGNGKKESAFSRWFKALSRSLEQEKVCVILGSVMLLVTVVWYVAFHY